MAVVPFAVWRPVPSHSGTMTSHDGLVLHVQVGTSSCYPEFADVANQASSTWWVGKDGTLEQYVDSDQAAWTEAAGNYTWDSVETEGWPSEPLTPAQIATLGRLYAWGVQQYGWPLQTAETPFDRGLGWHGMGGGAWGGHVHCPGDIRKAQRVDILAVARAAKPPEPKEPDMLSYLPVACPTGGYWIVRTDVGGVDCYDGAPFFDSIPGKYPHVVLDSPIVSLTPFVQDGAVKGYWLTSMSGGCFTFGEAPYLQCYAEFPQLSSPGAFIIGLLQTGGFVSGAPVTYKQLRREPGEGPDQFQEYRFPVGT